MEDISLGQLVHSRAGRDKGKYFFVVDVINTEYVLLADGDLRSILKPKKKKIKHLVFHRLVSEEIEAELKGDRRQLDSKIRKCLQSMNLNE